MTVLAKGVRKPKSKKRGALEVFSRVVVQVQKAKGFDLVTEVEIVTDYKSIRSKLQKVALAYYFLESVDKLTSMEEKNLQLYSLLEDNLEKLNNEVKNLRDLQEVFTKDILTLLGYWPEEKHMVNTVSAMREVTERDLTSVRVGKKVLN